MAFTKEELQQLKGVVQETVDESISKAVLPIINSIHDQMGRQENRMDGMQNQMDGMQKQMDGLVTKEEHNELVEMVNRIEEELIDMIGAHTLDKVPMKDHEHLKGRVHKIEMHPALAV